MSEFKVRYFNDNICKLDGTTGTVLRINREFIPQLMIQEDLKGLYILWGEGEYYVGQGFIKTRITQHFNNKDKHFSRVFILTYNGTYEGYQEFSHYLLDLEGALDGYLSNLGLSTMNRASTLQQDLLAQHQQVYDEWVKALHVLDPTFLQPTLPMVEESTPLYIPTNIPSINNSDDETHYEVWEGEQVGGSILVSQLTEQDLVDLAKVPVTQANAQPLQDIRLSKDRVIELHKQQGYINRTIEGLYYQEPLINIRYTHEGVTVTNPLEHFTQQQVRDIERALDPQYINNGEVVKQQGVPRKIYQLLVSMGAITELRQKKVHYYLNDTLADEWSMSIIPIDESGTSIHDIQQNNTTTLTEIVRDRG